MNQKQASAPSKGDSWPTVRLGGPWSWQSLLGHDTAAVTTLLADRLGAERWFGSKSREIRNVAVIDSAELADSYRLVIVRVDFASGPSEYYQISLGVAFGAQGEEVLAKRPQAIWAHLLSQGSHPGVLYDPAGDAAFGTALLATIGSEATLPGEDGTFVARRLPCFNELSTNAPLSPRLMNVEQSNTSIAFGDRLIGKLLRRVETGLNPDIEINEYLTERGFAHVPPLAGTIEYHHPGSDSWGLAILQGFVVSQGDAWRDTLGRLEGFLAKTTPEAKVSALTQTPAGSLVQLAQCAVPAEIADLMGDFLHSAELLGKRTAQLHLALASPTDDPAFAPEPYNEHDRRRFCDSARALAEETWGQLRARSLTGLAGQLRSEIVSALPRVDSFFSELARQSLDVQKMRIHGDYHLGQVLVTSGDYVIIDFEGEPARPLAERRRKQLALRDVAGMIRSYHYASCAASMAAKQASPADAEAIESHAAGWYLWTSVAFLRGYQQTAVDGDFLPRDAEQIERTLSACLLEKAIYELCYELNNRPDWIHLPLQALVELLRDL